MTQIKKVPFDYEYFKANPETKLETRNGKQAFLIGEKKIKNEYPLVFESVSYSHFTTILNGKFEKTDSNNSLDIFMLLEPKEEVGYANVYDDHIAGIYDTLEKAFKSHVKSAKSVVEFIIVDGEIVKCKTVHKY